MKNEPFDFDAEDFSLIDLKGMTAEEFADLGATDMAYIRPAMTEQGLRFVITTGDGSQVAAAPTFETAYTAAVQLDLEPVTLN